VDPAGVAIVLSPLAQQLLSEAKRTRIDRWRSEVDPSDVVCSCSERLELESSGGGNKNINDDGGKSAGKRCAACGRVGETLEQQQREHEQRERQWRRPRRRKDAGSESRATSFIRRLLSRRPGKDAGGGRDGAAASLSGPGPRPGREDSGTQMYQQDEADDEASGSSLGGGLSDSNKGNAKPKTRLDDSAARLRRAQKLLLNAQGKGKGC
jgi:hypothetical protein